MSARRQAQATETSPLEAAVSNFGYEVHERLQTGYGSRENHLRTPFEALLANVASRHGLRLTPIGEVRLPNLSARPDYAVEISGARAGYVELKQPGFGIPDTWKSPQARDVEQWSKLQLLPNVLYSDGQDFGVYHYGVLRGEVARLGPSIEHSAQRLKPIQGNFENLITSFLLWEPENPRSLDELVRLAANLCRLLRQDISDKLVQERSAISLNNTFTDLASDWRQVLFPRLSDAEFADQYSQTVTFALLLARVEGVGFYNTSISEIARLLGQKHSLMGRALAVLTDLPDDELSIAVTTMIRVFAPVDWSAFPDESYSMLYEDFLEKYDPELRKSSGVYYTPTELVQFVTKFVDNLLRSHLGKQTGFADGDVIVVDPAMGTGSFLAEVVNSVAATVCTTQGPGAVVPRLRQLSNRLIGLENQAAPFAVAELRLHALLHKKHQADIPDGERRFLADTLDDPDQQELSHGRAGSIYRAIENSRLGANRVKTHEPVMVVLGNPPYVDKVKGSAPWVEASRNSNRVPSLLKFRKSGNGRLEYVLSNKYVYFWRWATWKVFDAHPAHPSGIVAFVCSAGFTSGRGFDGMREYLRRTTDEGWIVDLSPEGHQPPVSTRFFRGNQQPLCVAIFVRNGHADPETPAVVRRISIAGTVQEKIDHLQELDESSTWDECLSGWTDPFRAPGEEFWESLPKLNDIMPWTTPGVKPNRTWVYATDKETLRRRWTRLIKAGRREKSALLKETDSVRIDSKIGRFEGMRAHVGTLAGEGNSDPSLQRVLHRSFDRKWVVADARVHDRPRIPLWSTRSDDQIYVVEQHAEPIADGPALLFADLVPDMHCHSGRGGRVLALYRDAAASNPNILPGLLAWLANELRIEICPIDLIYYLAATMGHASYTSRFAPNLKAPGVRVLITLDSSLWREAVGLGAEIVHIHTFGARGAPSSNDKRPTYRKAFVLEEIPGDLASMPNCIRHDSVTEILHVGNGEIGPVSADAWRYQVSGMPVIKHWFDYRKKVPSGRGGSALDDLTPSGWSASMTTELLEIVAAIENLISLDPLLGDLLDRIETGPLARVEDLRRMELLPVPAGAKRAPRQEKQTDLFAAGSSLS